MNQPLRMTMTGHIYLIQHINNFLSVKHNDNFININKYRRN